MIVVGNDGTNNHVVDATTQIAICATAAVLTALAGWGKVAQIGVAIIAGNRTNHRVALCVRAQVHLDFIRDDQACPHTETGGAIEAGLSDGTVGVTGDVDTLENFPVQVSDQ